MTNQYHSGKERPVSPHDCLLLIAIPLEKQCFIADLDSASGKDFARHFSKGRETLSGEGLWNLYQPYASLAIDVIQEARERGVEVIENATLQDFSTTVMRREVTTLVTHWRSPLFGADDITAIVTKVVEIDEQFRTITGFSCRGLDTEELATKLNAYLQESVPSEASGGNARVGALTRNLMAMHQRRRDLEQQIPNMFKGGSAVEFSDALFALDRVVDEIPAEFAGILDLTVCNSVMLGDAVRKKCDHALVMVNEQAASLDFRLAMYRQVIRSLARKPQSYNDASMDLRKRLDRHLS